MTLSICLWVTLLSTVTVCSSSLNFEPRSSIVGGEDATPGRWPWMVYLSISNGTHNFKCGGSLVNNHWVLTAAHCLVLNVGKINLLLSYARLGVLKLTDTNTGEHLHFHLFLIHPEYSVIYGAPLNDIALMRLKRPVPISYTVAPVILPGPRDVFTLNSECWVTGWGHIAEKRPLGGDQTLQQVKLPLVDNRICKKAYPETNNKQLCAGYLEGGKDSCQGDSGGPLVCKSFGVFVQVGVVSFGHGCGRYGYPGVYTRVYNYMQFIEDTIRKYR